MSMYGKYSFLNITRKSKTEAVLQRRVMESVLCHEMVTWSSSVMLGRGNSFVYFRYTGRVRIFGHFLQFV